MPDKDYIIIVQCDLVMQRCSGYYCEQALHERTGGFAQYPADKAYRTICMTCGGCCGLPSHRKLSHLLRKLKSKEKKDKQNVVVHLSTCITKDNFHGPPCPHMETWRIHKIYPLTRQAYSVICPNIAYSYYQPSCATDCENYR